MGMATYYLVANGHYVIWLYYNFYRSVEHIFYSTNHNIYSRMQAGEEFMLWQNLLFSDAFPMYCPAIMAALSNIPCALIVFQFQSFISKTRKTE